MQKTNIVFIVVISLLVAACGAGEITNGETVNQSDTELLGKESNLVDEKLIEQVVGQYGAKSSEQLRLEELLSQMNASILVHKGKETEQLFGHWVGSFGKNKINITLVSIDEADSEKGKAFGYSVCAGNFRALTGTFKAEGNQSYSFVLSEPGDDLYDGTFEFAINLTKGNLEGNWTPFVAKGNSSKKYELTQKEYLYDPSKGEFPEASQRILSADELGFYYTEDLTYMRNEIYARHGYSFKNKDMRYFFEAQDWYIPMGIDIRYNLTPIEIVNIGLIYEYETYYEAYYDGYGR
jgi:hypothetical protein